MSELSIMQSDSDIDSAVEELRTLRRYIKKLGKDEEALIQKIVFHMKEHEILINLDGEELVTYKYASDSKYFDSAALKAEDPELYNVYMKTRPGSRRFVIK